MTWRRLLLVVSLALGLALFAQSLRSLGRAQIIDGVMRVGWGFAAILVLAGVREAVRTLAWMRTVEGPVSLGFARAFRARLAGEALNALLPMGMVVGEPTKASRAGAIPFATAFSALAVEFAFYCASLVVLFTAAASAWASATSRLSPAAATLLAGVAYGLVAVAIAFARRRRARALPASADAETVPAWRRVSDTVLGFASRHPEHVRSIVAYELAYHALGVVEVYVTLLLVSPVQPTIASAVVLESVSRAVTMGFKMLPMRVGVDEVGSSLFAARVNLDAATGVTLALVRKLRLLFWSAIGLALLIERAPADSPVVARQ